MSELPSGMKEISVVAFYDFFSILFAKASLVDGTLAQTKWNAPI